jgi:hypothetical protein
MQNTIRICVIVLVVIAAALLFWPGVHDYGQTHGGILVRVNRFTGKTEHYIAGDGWRTPTPVPTPTLDYIDQFKASTPSALDKRVPTATERDEGKKAPSLSPPSGAQRRIGVGQGTPSLNLERSQSK